MRLAFLAVFLFTVAGCGNSSAGDGTTSDPTAETAVTATGYDFQAGVWTRLPESPLSPRESPASAYVGDEVVFVGGYGGMPCPPTADCVSPPAERSDGAAYDLAKGTWRRIAEAPLPVSAYAPTAVIGKDVYVLADKALLVWNSAGDYWNETTSQQMLLGSDLVADGSRLVVVSGSDERGVRPDRVLDTRTGQWSVLPSDPLKPSFDRTVTATPEGFVLTALPIESDGSPADPALIHAAVLPLDGRTWRELAPGDQLGGGRWAWTGERLVDPTLGGADGGQVNNFGRVIPYGGRLDLSTGTWSALPDSPDQGTGEWPVEARGGPLSAVEGWIYDDANGSWTRVPRPEGAPPTPGVGVWAGNVLAVYGGADWSQPDALTPENVWSTGIWAYRAD